MVERLKPYKWFILWALCNHLLFLWLSHAGNGRQLFGDEYNYLNLSQNVFSQFDPHPFWPPGHFYFLGIIHKVFGSFAAYYVLQVLALGGCATFLCTFLIRLGFAKDHCIKLGFLIFGWPELAGMTYLYWPEITHLFLFSAAIFFSFHSAKKVVGGGLFWGLAISFKLVFSVFTPILLVFLWLYHRRWQSLALWLFALVLTCLPTLLWNYHRLGYMTMGSSGPFNIWVGVTDPDSSDAVKPQAGARKREFDSWEGSLKEKNAMALSHAFKELKAQGIQAVYKQPIKNLSRLLSSETTLVTFIPPGPRNRYDIGASIGSHALRWYLRIHHMLMLLAWVRSIRLWPMRKKWVFHHLGNAAFIMYGLAFVFLHCKTRFLIPFFPWILMMAWTKEQEERSMNWKRATAMMVIFVLALRFTI